MPHVCSEALRRKRKLLPLAKMGYSEDALKKRKCTKCLRILPLVKFAKRCAHFRQPCCSMCIYKHTKKRKSRSNVQRKWSIRNKLKITAHAVVKRAIARGLMKRPKRCSECSSSKLKVEAHHDNYRKPLSVRWLCSSCHKLFHSLRRLV